MNMRIDTRLVLLVALVSAALLLTPKWSSAEPTGRQLAIATVHPLATDAALEVFREGGNAVDAAVAAALTLGVVDSHNSGIGGGCLILVRTPDGTLLAIDGRDSAPAAAHSKMFVRDGRADSRLSQTGPLAVCTPGALAAYADLVSECGRLKLSRLLAPGIAAAQEGFPLDEKMARKLASQQHVLKSFPGSRDALLLPDGNAPSAGHLFVQPDLARTYRHIAEFGPKWFYNGQFARRVNDWMAEHGGVLTQRDFANYQAKRRQPVVSSYRGFTVAGFPPPSSGGVHVAQILNLLELKDMRGIFKKRPVDGMHVVAEAMKLAFADRAHWLGDSDFVEVPRGLVSKEYAKELSQRISLEKASKVAGHGEPRRWRQDIFGRHTTHIAAADSQGYWVAITATINTSFGSKVVVPGTGVVLNNMMDDFAIHPGTPNAFGLIGAEYNAIAGGKRPLSSMSPTIVLDEQQQPIMAVGAAGGPRIITQVLCVLVNTIDRDMTPETALKQPRYHHQWAPDRLALESTMPEELVESLRQKGHNVSPLSSIGVVQLIARDGNGKLVAAHDPHVAGKAVVQFAAENEGAHSNSAEAKVAP